MICLNWSGDEYLRHHGNLLNRRKIFCLIRKRGRKKDKQSKEEIKEKLKIFITRYQAERKERTDSVLSKRQDIRGKKEIS